MSKKARIFFAYVSEKEQPKFMSPPLGLLYMAAYLRERFPLEIQVVHQEIERLSTEALARRIIDFDADVAAISCMTPAAYSLVQLTAALRASRPGMLIVVGGPHISAVREVVLETTCADVAVPGEGEIALEQILQRHLEGGDLTDIPGIIYRNANNEIIINPGIPPFIESLDTLPFPAYDLIDIRQYWSRPSMAHVPQRKYITLFSSRGCPYGCIFCNKIFGRAFRAHSPERIVEEVKYYIKQYDVKEIEYVDDCFNLDTKRVTAYTECLLKEVGPVPTAFSNGLRADLMSDDIVEALVRTGMYFVVLPLESGSPRIQQLMHKRLDIDKFIQAVKSCANRRVFTHCFTMFGSPTETLEEMKETVRIVVHSQLHTCAFFVAVPFPNTELYEYALKHIPEEMAKTSYDQVDFERVRYNLSAVPTEEFSDFFNKIRLQFYGRPDRLFRIMRDYPRRMHLPLKGLKFLYNFMKGTY